MGRSFYGDIWRTFWVDQSGREYDPEKVSAQVWTYLKKTGVAAKIDEARTAGKCSEWIRIVSVNPTVVLMIPCQHKRFADSKIMQSHGTKVAQELAFVPESHMYFDEPMQWLSPDLAKGPTTISFSAEGKAEIPLKSGKLKLVHEGERCKITRE